MKGNFRAKSFQITDLRTGQLVAETQRKGQFSSLTKFVTGDDTYMLTVRRLPVLQLRLLLCGGA